jgi:hypothetical protein
MRGKEQKMVRFGLVAVLVACNGKDPVQNPNEDDSGHVGGPLDLDEDGVLSDVDCNDDDAAIHPGADETCNGLDDDCNGTIDDDLLATFHRDADRDGYGDLAAPASACAMPAGFVTDSTDCDDAAAAIHPGAVEVCDFAGVDEDCNGQVNEDDPGLSDIQSWYVDADEDGFGDSAKTAEACFEAPGLATIGTDCDDADAARNPGAAEVCDALDLDEDCDGASDVDDPEGPAGQPLYYVDADHDGAGDMTDPGQYFCDGVPGGYSTLPTDCDDIDDLVNPNAPEFCQDAIDNDCNGAVDDCGPIADVSLSTADVSIFGTDSYENLGWDVADLGDLDGDHVADFGSSSPWGSSDEGRGRIFSGPIFSGTDLDADDEATAKITGNGGLGHAMRGAGDVDGDGFDDVVVGAPYRVAGAAYVLLGPIRGNVSASTSADATWEGEETNDAAGYVVEGGFDYNFDGFADYVIGAPEASITFSNEGAAYLVYGPGLGDYSLADADTRIVGNESYARFGGSVAALGDTDGDGAGELAVGAEQMGDDENGRVFIFGGGLGESIDAETGALGWYEGEAYDNIGRRVADGGDFNDDGYADLLIGSPWASGSGTNSGTVYLIAGPMDATGAAQSLAYAEFYGEGYNTDAGEGIDGSMDLNRDGFTDVLVGAPAADYAGGLYQAGSTYLVYGPQSGAMSLANARVNVIGLEEGQYSGSAVAFIGDQDGDDSPEILTGAKYTDASGGGDSGALYVVLGGRL